MHGKSGAAAGRGDVGDTAIDAAAFDAAGVGDDDDGFESGQAPGGGV